jgi:AraC-like DNA-binding protein
MKIVCPEDVDPEVRHCNYFKVKSGRGLWGPRTILDFELIYIVAGEFSYSSHRGKRVVHEGDVLCIPPGEQHIFRLEKQPAYGALIGCIHLDLLENMTCLNGDYIPKPKPFLITSTHNDHALHQLFRNCRDVSEGYGTRRKLILKNIVSEIWLRMHEYRESQESDKFSRRLNEMLDFINERIPSVVTRQDLSRKFGLVPEHINAIFKKEMNMTPTQVVQRTRIRLACRYLQEEGLSIKETAELCGFKDQFYFTRVFTKLMNTTPGKFAGK